MTTREVAYAVVGTNARELEAAITALGPRRRGRAFAAYTDWSIVWRYQAENVGGACRVAAHAVEARATLTLPTWRPLRAVPDGLRDRWSRWVEALRAHEEGHVQIASRARVAVIDAIGALPPSPDAEALHAAVERVAAEAIERARAEDRDYDLATSDGAAQGAGLGALCLGAGGPSPAQGALSAG